MEVQIKFKYLLLLSEFEISNTERLGLGYDLTVVQLQKIVKGHNIGHVTSTVLLNLGHLVSWRLNM